MIIKYSAFPESLDDCLFIQSNGKRMYNENCAATREIIAVYDAAPDKDFPALGKSEAAAAMQDETAALAVFVRTEPQ